MKYLVVLCDGMADYPVEELGNKTPLEAADTPNMDRLAKKATVGLVKTVQDGMKPGIPNQLSLTKQDTALKEFSLSKHSR